MNLRLLIRYMPNLWATRDLILYLVLMTVLVLCCFVGLGKVGISYTEAEQTVQKMNEMTAYVEDWKKKVQEVNKAAYRPVKATEVDSLQSNILLLLSAHQLDLKVFRNVQRTGKDLNGLSYELTMNGSWVSLVRFLEDFHVKNTLIAVQRLKVDPDPAFPGHVNAVLEYKIYTL